VIPSLISLEETPVSALAGTTEAASATDVTTDANKTDFLLRRKLIIYFLPSRVFSFSVLRFLMMLSALSDRLGGAVR
jgi:hypothetical protein